MTQPDPSRDEWDAIIRPALKIPRLDLLGKLSGLSRRMLIEARAGRGRPHRKNRQRLASVLQKIGLI